MEFAVTAWDYPNAFDRRAAVRPQHLATMDTLIEDGHLSYGVALVDDQDRMIGSLLICHFDDRAALDEWLRTEPYVTGNVWERIDVQPCKIGPRFRQVSSQVSS